MLNLHDISARGNPAFDLSSGRPGASTERRPDLVRLRRGTETALPNLLDSLHEQVASHTSSKVLADDCTMLALRRLAPDC
jgi:hypothetical protein